MLKGLRLPVDAVTTWENINDQVLCFNLSDAQKKFSDAYLQVSIEDVILN